MTTDPTQPNPVVPPTDPSAPPAAPPQAAPTPPQPGQAGYDPLLDPKTRTWRDEVLRSVIQRDQTIASLTQERDAERAERAKERERLAQLEAKEKERAEAEMTEIQKHQSRATDFEKQLAEIRAQHEADKAARAEMERQFQEERQRWSDESLFISTLNARGIFPNPYEYEGLKGKLRTLSYANEEERNAKIVGLIDTFITETQRNQPAPQPQTAPMQPSGQQLNPGVRVIPVPPGGNPAATGQQLLEDNYSPDELIALSRSDPQKYQAIKQQRVALAKARGATMIRQVYA